MPSCCTVVGQQLAKLLPDDGAAGEQFGLSVAISGSIAIVGAYLDGEFGDCCHGSAYLFDVNTGERLWKSRAPGARGLSLRSR